VAPQYICDSVFTVLEYLRQLCDSVFTGGLMDARTKRIWTGLVSYANGTATDTEVWSTVAEFIGWISVVDSYGIFGWVGDNSLSVHVAEHRTGVDALLRFLCSAPKSAERESLRRQGALTFLYEHGRHIQGLHFPEVPYQDGIGKSLKNASDYPAVDLQLFEKQSRIMWDHAQYQLRTGTMAGKDLLPLGLKMPTRDYRDLADPICEFLMSEYQAYLNRFLSRAYSRHRKLEPVVPIFVCPGCNKLVMPERIGRKKYCSDCTDAARAEKYRHHAPAAEGRDYQWLYRLRHRELGLRKTFLRNEKNQMRLKQIKSRQTKSSRCQRLILDMKL
jgi:hypothetical protein